jgi:hypothetical protein
MERKDETGRAAGADQTQARREHEAQGRLAELGAGVLPAPPWRPEPMPPAAVDLVQLALWRAADLDTEHLLDALTLLRAARAEVDGLEAGLLFTARGAGLTWAQIAEAMGYRSPQACQQHFSRLAARQGEAS